MGIYSPGLVLAARHGQSWAWAGDSRGGGRMAVLLGGVLGGLQEGLEPHAEVAAGLVAVEQAELVDEHGRQRVAPGVRQAAGGHLAVGVEDGLEGLVEVLDRVGAQGVEDAADLGPVVGVRVGAAAGGDERAALGLGAGAQVGVVV